MNRMHAALLPLLLAVASAACQPRDAAAPAPADEAAKPAPAGVAPAAQAPIAVPKGDEIRSGVPNPIELPPPDAPTPPMAEGADITYTCEDGSELRITYAAGRANVTLADGGIVPLPRSPQAQQAGGEVFAGEALVLRRLGNVVELQQDEGDKRRCRESGGNA
jgi:hypothetical protein